MPLLNVEIVKFCHLPKSSQTFKDINLVYPWWDREGLLYNSCTFFCGKGV